MGGLDEQFTVADRGEEFANAIKADGVFAREDAWMARKILKWLGITVAVLLIAVIAIAGIGSSLSLDRDYTHTNNTAALPLLSSELSSSSSTPALVRISANGFEFRARVAGSSDDAPAVILLHGFPVTSAMWEPMIMPLANAGYRVIAFDQRGYSPGARPDEAGAYAIAELVSDVIAVADAVGVEKFHLIGHDWGSAVGWSTVLSHPDRVVSWTGLSIAHPAAFFDALENDSDQQSRSSYFALFTMPLVPEALFTFNNLVVLRGLYSAMAPLEQAEYQTVFAEPRALTSALNWYREMDESFGANPQLINETSTPTLFIWGNRDEAVGRTAIQDQKKYMTGVYREIELDADHWLMSTHADEVTRAVLEHLNSN